MSLDIFRHKIPFTICWLMGAGSRYLVSANCLYPGNGRAPLLQSISAETLREGGDVFEKTLYILCTDHRIRPPFFLKIVGRSAVNICHLPLIGLEVSGPPLAWVQACHPGPVSRWS